MDRDILIPLMWRGIVSVIKKAPKIDMIDYQNAGAWAIICNHIKELAEAQFRKLVVTDSTKDLNIVTFCNDEHSIIIQLIDTDKYKAWVCTLGGYSIPIEFTQGTIVAFFGSSLFDIGENWLHDANGGKALWNEVEPIIRSRKRINLFGFNSM